MTAPLPIVFAWSDALMAFDEPRRHLGRDSLDRDRWKVLRRFETEPAAPESWTPPLCSCGRCDGRGRLRIHTTGAEEWVPCRMVGGPRYLPAADAGDWWKS